MNQATRNAPSRNTRLSVAIPAHHIAYYEGLKSFMERMDEERRKVGWPVLNKSDKPNN